MSISRVSLKKGGKALLLDSVFPVRCQTYLYCIGISFMWCNSIITVIGEAVPEPDVGIVEFTAGEEPTSFDMIAVLFTG